ncbi:MAG: hypothetical protein H6610_04615 [Ignavibacteriales bacterium]|nr:hypothetical protein [Ignavibacteriales bacterium]MCB9218728.1 hypothetical protein [Ignavibacteriales bacterium]
MRNQKKLITFILLMFLSNIVVFGTINKTEKKSFNVNFGGKLFVDTDKGSILIKSHSAETIEVELFLKVKTDDEDIAQKILNDFEVEFDQSGSNLNIIAKYKGSKNWIGNIFGGNKSNKLNVKFEITVPEKYNVDLNTSGGGIQVDDLIGWVEANTSGGGLTFGNITGDINGKTSGGGITVGKCDGDIDIKTSGGGIDINKCKGSVKANTSGGGIKVKEVYGTINASTSGGSVFASILEQPMENCSLTTSGGGITVKLADNIKVDLDAKTSGGSVNTDFPITIQGKVERSKLEGVINGGGPDLYLRSSGGSINIEKN